MSYAKDWRLREREAFAKIFRELLEKEDITQKYFSDLSGVNIHHVYSYSNGKYFPNLDDFNKIAEYFGYSFNELYDMMEAEMWRAK